MPNGQLVITIIIIIIIIIVTQPLYESRMYWVHDPTPPTSRRPFWNLLIPLHPPLQRNLQELFPPSQSIRNPGEGGEGRLPGQPIRMQRSSQPPQWPRMTAGPMIIQHPREWPAPNQRPMTSMRWGVPQWSISKASNSLIWHSLPFQRPMRIQKAHLVWTAVNFLGFISRPRPTPGRIWQPPTQESTALDLASPHLLLSNPTPNPSLDCPLGSKWLVPIERLGEPMERGLESCTRCCPAPHAQTPSLW